MTRSVAYSASFLLCIMLLWTGEAQAELDDLSLATLEYGVDAERVRGLQLKRVPETSRWSRAKLIAAAQRTQLPLDPRLSLREDLPLYQSLGLVPLDSDRLPDIEGVRWPRLKAAFLPFDSGHRLIVATEASKADHMITVGLIALEQHFDLSGERSYNDRDHQLAVESMFLGDAVAFWLSRQNGDRPQELGARIRWGQEKLRGIMGPPSSKEASNFFIKRLLEARFVHGLAAVMEVHETSPWGVIDEMYRRGRPRSTAQLLHPKMLVQDRKNRDLRPTRIEALAGRGEPESGVLGELRLKLWLETWLDPAVAERATAGWAADAYQLYQSDERQPSNHHTLILLTAWDDLEEPAEAEALDFAGAVKVAQEKRLRGRARPLEAELPVGATGWVDDGLATVVEHRGDKVLFITGCPAKLVDSLRDDLWKSWRVGRVDLSAVGEINPDVTPAIAPMPTEEPWYSRTPGYVALIIWLALLLPALAYALTRLLRYNPVKVYLYGLVATIVVIVIGWMLNY